MRTSLAVLATVLVSSHAVAQDDIGYVCLAAAPTPTSGETSLANPAGGLPDETYSVRIDDLPPIALSRDSGKWSPGLLLGDRHTISIAADGARIASFHFYFEAIGSAEPCLFLQPLYRTWQLWRLDRTGSWCSCGVKPAV
jgi:hypothetical protein